MIRRYKVTSHNSTVCGYPGREFDWSKFCWDGSAVFKSIFKGLEDMKAEEPWTDDGLIAPDCQYLHVPYNFEEDGTIYRVRPNESMYAGEIYRGHKVIRQKVIKVDGFWYWELELEQKVKAVK